MVNGVRENWTVKNKIYSSISDFADAYIRYRNLMIYSNCNKFYRKEIIDKMRLRFREGIEFGEDRLFNYDFLKGCALFGRVSETVEQDTTTKTEERERSPFPDARKRGYIISFDATMISYLRRRSDSQSTKYVKNFYNHALQLHEAKVDCMFQLSKGTTAQERIEFRAYDIARVIDNTLRRFSSHPQEVEENLRSINNFVFGDTSSISNAVNVLIVLGSQNCEYKVKKALEIGSDNSQVIYIVSGGNPHKDKVYTEAEFMAEYLRKHGIDEEKIYLENHAQHSKENLIFSAALLAKIRNTGKDIKHIGILTSGFHLPRIKLLVQDTEEIKDEAIEYFAAYSPTINMDKWYKDPQSRIIVLGELRKTLILKDLLSLK